MGRAKGKKYDTNLVVIGAGAAGLISANIAATLKAKVTLIERHKMGGDCLNTGCVPSKTLLRSAKLMHSIGRAKEFGIDVAPAKVNFAALMGRVQGVIKHIEPVDSVERYTELGVDCISGEARLLDANRVEIDGNIISARHIIIASGARPALPQLAGLDGVDYLTSDNLWGLQDLPESLLIVGGGPIACEMAQAFSRLGSVVSIAQRSDSLLRREEAEVGEFIANSLADEGVELLFNCKLSAVEQDKTGAVLATLANGEQRRFSKILFAIGRTPNTEDLGLEQAGVKLNSDGSIKVDAYLRSSQKNILACGDVVGPYQFTHMASHQAWYACVNALLGFVKKFKVDYSLVPRATFTDPEVASVGKLETELKREGRDYESLLFPLDDMDRALTEGEAKGFIKVLTAKGSDKILGVTIVGAHAAELLTEFVAAMKNGYGLNRILGTIHIYPSFSEANKYLAGQWKRRHAPQWALGLLQKLHAWRR
ncbi:MAG: FAD-dependent oxidoreductase [Cellvibrionaceae bacterium]|nr:FAD-dependent oxidoreductase [Cellvibrionaceae bacterium]